MQLFKKLLTITRSLRAPKGCPWDQKQTVQTLLPYLESEVKEVRAAIRKKDHANLAEELGDVLLNIAMITTIAEEKKLFTMEDVLRGVIHKVKSRHTWVFGSDRHKVKTAADARKLWLLNKKKGKKMSSPTKSRTKKTNN